MLVLKDIIKNYSSHEVLNIVLLTFEPGVHWIKGSNGVGKSTLFRVIAGQTPFTGTIKLNDVHLEEDTFVFKSRISFAEAEPQYPSFLKAIELISFHEEVRTVPSSVVMELCNLFELSHHLQQKIGTFSSGMLKKLSLVCCLLADVDLYILDEPLITLDADTTSKLCKLIVEMNNRGKSFLISSHQDLRSTGIRIDKTYQIKDKTLLCMD